MEFSERPVAEMQKSAAMSDEILINVTPQETRVAVIQQGVVQELHIERASSRGLVGNVYVGRVSRVLPGMQSAFIDIGLDRAAFLHVADIWAPRQNGQAALPIERLLSEGQSLLVQVIKDPIGGKGARLSTQISIAGRFLVYLPHESHIGISQRIEDETERQMLKERLLQLIPPGEGGGYIIRTVAEGATDAELVADIAYLRKQWADIQEKFRTSGPPALLYQDLTLALRVLRDFVGEETGRILVDSRETYQKMLAFAADFVANVVEKIEHYAGERPLFDLYGVEDEIEKALARRVDLKSGGYLIIDQTEALTTIDVNTGGYVSGRSFDETIFKTNLEAAQVIARQLRLRNLGGIIIIDFIDMDSEEHRAAVLSEFKKALARDRTKMTVNGFTALGLVEMTRKRTRESLAHILCEPCPTCQGRGEIKTAQTVCYEILRELLREARQFNAREFRILASQTVIDMFLDEESQSLAQLGDFIGKPVSLQVETLYTQEQYDVVLM
jgi:ribonuclease G